MIKFNTGKLLDNDRFLKILSLVLAIIAWVVVAIVVNPNQSITVKDIKVKIPLTDTTAATKGLDIVEGGDQTVDVLVRGKRYKVGALKADDFTAIADATAVTAAGEFKLDVSVSKASPSEEYEIVSVSPSKISVRFDRVVSKQWLVEAVAENVKVAEGFVRSQPYTDPEQITVKGPESDVAKIGKIEARVSTSETLNQSFTTESDLIVYDKDGKKLDLKSITLEPSTCKVTIPVSKTKSMPVKFEYKNVPDNFPIDELKYTMSTNSINVSAPSDAIDNVQEISLGQIDFRNIDIGSEFSLEVGLPAGFINVDSVNEVKVKFNNTNFTSKSLTLSSFSIVNIPSNFTVKPVTKRLNKVKIIGPPSVIAGITAQDVVAKADLLDVQVSTGQVTVPLKISLPNKGLVWAVGEYNIIVSASPK